MLRLALLLAVIALAACAIAVACLRHFRAAECPITGAEFRAALERRSGASVLHPAAPAQTDSSQRYKDKVTIFHPYYKNKATLERLLATYWAAPASAKERLVLMIVDDASPLDPAAEVVRAFAKRHPDGAPFEVRVVTLEEDIGFNVAGARNTGVEAAPTEVVVFADIDFAVPPGEVEALLRAAPDLEADPFRLYCVRHEKDWYTTMWMVSKKAFRLLGGYDEDYSGQYGGEEQDFHDRAFRTSLVRTEYHPHYVVTEASLAANRATDHCSSCQDAAPSRGERRRLLRKARALWGRKQVRGPNRDVGRTVRVPWHQEVIV